jgi:hypothetical protein
MVFNTSNNPRDPGIPRMDTITLGVSLSGLESISAATPIASNISEFSSFRCFA